jgi:hypothetical protein
MVDRPRSAAASLYPNLPSGMPDVVERRHTPSSIADAMFGHLRPLPPAPRNWHRELLLKDLRELNARHRASK